MQPSGDVIKQSDDTFGKIRELEKRWNNRLRFNNLRLIERYQKGELFLHVHIRSDAGEEYCAIFNRCDRAATARQSPHKTQTNECLSPIQPSSIVRNGYCQQQPMLIDIIQLVETPDGVIPSLVWFQRINAIHERLRKALYFSWATGFIFIGVPGNGEAVLSGPGNRGRDQPVDEMIEGRPEVMDSITRETDNVGGNIFKNFDPMDWISALRVKILDDSVWVSRKEGFNAGIEIIDVLFGPFNLDSRVGIPSTK